MSAKKYQTKKGTNMPAIIVKQKLIDELAEYVDCNNESRTMTMSPTSAIMKLHERQKDRAGAPYTKHLSAVAEQAAVILCYNSYPDISDENRRNLKSVALQVGVCHDTFEDIRVERADGSITSFNHDDLMRLGYSKEVALTVDLLTKPEHDTNEEKKKPVGPLEAWQIYKKQIQHLIEPPAEVYSDRTLLMRYIVAITCKIADNQHNADIRRLPEHLTTRTSTYNAAAKYSISAATLHLTLNELINYLNSLDQE